MKAKAIYGVSILVVFALAAIGFSMIPGSVSGAGDSGFAEPPAGAEVAAASPIETNTADTGTEGTDNTFYGNLAGDGNTAQYGTFIGAEAGASSNSGDSNTFVGQRCGWKNTSGDSNTFVGRNAGAFNTEGHYNTFMGRAAGYRNTTGSLNTFVGSCAGLENKEGIYNTFVGYYAGYKTTTDTEGNSGEYNTFMGNYSGYFNDTGDFNTFIGERAGYINKKGCYNTFVGSRAGYSTTTIEGNSGISSTFVGTEAGYHNTIGNGNTFIGRDAGFYNETGSYNVFLGYWAGGNETGSNKLYIDNSDTSTPLIWGDFEIDKVQINGGFRAVATSTSSDRRWKKNIKPLASSLDKISGLQGVSYEWNREDYPDMGMMEGKQIGLVAQDVEQVLPELVSEDKDGYKAVSYTKLTAVLVEAVKELKAENQRQKELLQEQLQKQQAEIEELRSIIKELKS